MLTLGNGDCFRALCRGRRRRVCKREGMGVVEQKLQEEKGDFKSPGVLVWKFPGIPAASR